MKTRKIKWNKDGPWTFLGFAQHSDREETLLLFKGVVGGLQAMTYDNVRTFSFAGRPRNSHFSVIEEGSSKGTAKNAEKG